ncbi:uncharacterized protein YndB with AHSA1/START domain/biotin operon repressor [Pedobacter sp. CAN_A7]|uniref:metalloregulator ArsR/SmtB family transcription factor n=1 Tax=Pedobacter sp. CAN_A7 TaxID=2787722 RepID=UPI001A2BA4F1
MKARRDVYQAIADPTRREIINLIVTQPYNVNAIAEKFDMTRQAVSLHVKILEDCGLIVIKQSGRERFCELQAEQLDEVATWISQSKTLWLNRFEKINQYLNEVKPKAMENNKKDLLITHLFDAPIELVFNAWTDPEQLKHWYAPDGCSIEFKAIEVKVGGEFHSCIHDPVHGDCWIKGTYQEVTKNEKLVFSMELSNEQGIAVSANDAGKSEDWPEALITTVTFSPVGDQTKITLHQTVAETEARKTGAYQSWFSMFDRLSTILVSQTP